MHSVVCFTKNNNKTKHMDNRPICRTLKCRNITNKILKYTRKKKKIVHVSFPSDSGKDKCLQMVSASRQLILEIVFIR